MFKFIYRWWQLGGARDVAVVTAVAVAVICVAVAAAAGVAVAIEQRAAIASVVAVVVVVFAVAVGVACVVVVVVVAIAAIIGHNRSAFQRLAALLRNKNEMKLIENKMEIAIKKQQKQKNKKFFNLEKGYK